jgi:allophanate hydrolase
MWQQVDTLLLLTVATTYTVADVEADPIVKNSHLGYYTNFVSLLGYAGVSVHRSSRSKAFPLL